MISRSVSKKHRDTSKEWLFVYNESGLVGMAGGVAEMFGNASNALKFRRPTADDIENCVVISDVDIANTLMGVAWELGTHPVKYTGTDPAIGDKMGSQAGSFYAKKSDNGIWLVRDVDTINKIAYVFLGGSAAADAPSVPASVDTIGVNTEGTEVAGVDTWLVTDDPTKGLDIYIMVRDAYFDTGDETWYGYIRKFTHDETGRLVQVSAETRITIDAPGPCP